MDLDDYLKSLPKPEREAFAEQARTSIAMLRHVAKRRKPIELGFADVLVALSGHQVSLDDLRLTENAQSQRSIREASIPKRRRRPQPAIAAAV